MADTASDTEPGSEDAFEMYGDGTLPEDADLMAPNAKQTTPESEAAGSERAASDAPEKNGRNR